MDFSKCPKCGQANTLHITVKATVDIKLDKNGDIVIPDCFYKNRSLFLEKNAYVCYCSSCGEDSYDKGELLKHPALKKI